MPPLAEGANAAAPLPPLPMGQNVFKLDEMSVPPRTVTNRWSMNESYRLAVAV